MQREKKKKKEKHEPISISGRVSDGDDAGGRSFSTYRFDLSRAGNTRGISFGDRANNRHYEKRKKSSTPPFPSLPRSGKRPADFYYILHRGRMRDLLFSFSIKRSSFLHITYILYYLLSRAGTVFGRQRQFESIQRERFSEIRFFRFRFFFFFLLIGAYGKTRFDVIPIISPKSSLSYYFQYAGAFRKIETLLALLSPIPPRSNSNSTSDNRYRSICRLR